MSTTREADGPNCAHLHVEYQTEDFRLSEEDAAAMLVHHKPHPVYAPPHAGQIVTRGRWACRDCSMRFVPAAFLAARFTHEDVEVVHRVWSGCDGTLDAEDNDRVYPDGIVIRMKDVRRLQSLASRLAALLPPPPQEPT